MAQLGRISGPLLNANLERNGVDLKFSNTTFDTTPVLFIDVNNGRIGIKDDTPSFDLDINNDARTTNMIVDDSARIDNIIPISNSFFTTKVGPINILPTASAGSYVLHNRMRSDDLEFNDNTIFGITSNQSIDLKPNGTGTLEVAASTSIYGDLGVTGNINIDGNLTKLGNLIVGDELYDPDTGQGDTVEIIPDFTQSIIPGDDNLWDLGRDQLDSSPRRWAEVYITDNLSNANRVNPQEVFVSDQTHINGRTNEIFALQSNDDMILAPDTGINIIERTRWQEISASSTSASISGRTLTVGGTITGAFIPGTQLSGIGIQPGTVILETSTGSDSSGTYIVNINYNGSGSNPSPTGTIAITGTVDVIENLTDIGGGPRMTPETPLTFASTGIGYLRFMGDNAFVLPSGTDAERPAKPELGDTRWNTDQDYLESFAGAVEVVTAVANLAGLPNQFVSNRAGTTDGNGENATFDLTITSGSLSIAINNRGQGYSTNDLITIPGTVFSGGTTPTNDIIVTVGAQTDDGYNIATGGGAEVNVALMEELGDAYSLILG